MVNVEGLLGKVANNGATTLGILVYSEWNTLVQAVKELQGIVGSDNRYSELNGKVVNVLQRLANVQASMTALDNSTSQKMQALTSSFEELKSEWIEKKEELDSLNDHLYDSWGQKITQLENALEVFKTSTQGDINNLNTELSNISKYHTAFFDGFVLMPVSITSMGISTQNKKYSIVYSYAHHKFLIKVGINYYDEWVGREEYNDINNQNQPFTTKQYIYNGNIYMYDAETGRMVQMSTRVVGPMSTEEYEAMENKDDTVLYAITEE